MHTDRLSQLIELKYQSVGDALKELEPAEKIHDVFVNFQWVPNHNWSAVYSITCPKEPVPVPRPRLGCVQ